MMLKECFVMSECFLIAFNVWFRGSVYVQGAGLQHTETWLSALPLKRGHRARPCSPPSATQMCQTKTELCEHTTPPRSLALLPAHSLWHGWRQSVREYTWRPPTVFSLQFFLNLLLLALLLCLHFVRPLSNLMVMSTGKPRNTLFSILVH